MKEAQLTTPEMATGWASFGKARRHHNRAAVAFRSFLADSNVNLQLEKNWIIKPMLESNDLHHKKLLNSYATFLYQ